MKITARRRILTPKTLLVFGIIYLFSFIAEIFYFSILIPIRRYGVRD